MLGGFIAAVALFSENRNVEMVADKSGRAFRTVFNRYQEKMKTGALRLHMICGTATERK